MNGLWKENVSGWNHKDSKRRKQTRNNTIRDKGRMLLRVYSYACKRRKLKHDTDVYRRESERVLVSQPLANKPLVKTTFAQKAAIDFVSGYKPETYELKHLMDGEIVVKEYIRMIPNIKTISMLIYFDENETSYDRNKYNAYDVKTRIPVWKILKLKNPHSRDFTIAYTEKTKIEVKLDWEKVKERYDTLRIESFNDCYCKEYLFRKPLPDWKRYTLYNDGKRRKIGQSIANRTDRVIIRDWISKGDWDSVASTHRLTKSIAWFIS